MAHSWAGNSDLFPLVIAVPASVTGTNTETWSGAKIPSFVQSWQLMAADLCNGGAVSADGSNYLTITVSKGATAMATFTTSTTAISSDTPVAMTLSTTVANRIVTAGDLITVAKTAAGTGASITVPAQFVLWFKANRDLNAT